MTDYTKKFARLLVDYSTEVKKGDRVLIRGSQAAEPLIESLYEYILKKGAQPVVKVKFPWQDSLYYKHATKKMLEEFPEVDRFEYEHTDVSIYIKSDINTKEMSGADSKKIGLRRQATNPVSDYIMGTNEQGEPNVRWCVTLFPTYAYAQQAELSLSDFQDFVYSALFLNKRSPTKEWKKLSKRQQTLVDLLNRSKEVRVVGDKTDLILGIEGRTAINSDGKHNMPSGEVFTAPIEDSVQGVITFTSFPQMYMGKEVAGIILEFRDGKVVDASAEKNEEFLIAMLDTDDGSRTLGELGIGTNAGIQRCIKNILFDEKIGGSAHFALGRAYEENGGKNKSAIHWDLIKDLRGDGALFIDGVKYVWKKDSWAKE